MYSGTTVSKKSGLIIGVHQRIDRIARRRLTSLLPANFTFPTTAQILHFEGNNGPDGIKRKSPSVDEPWHYIDPKKPLDRAVIDMILDHQANLAKALKENNQERAAFEAAWMAHAIVDGLTPAHHDPFGEQIEELFGISLDERVSVKEKNIVRGVNKRDTLKRNWAYWGKSGLMMNHFWFEIGIATSILGKKYEKDLINQQDIDFLAKQGYEKVFRTILEQIVAMDTYEKYKKSGWNRPLAKLVQQQLVPLIIKAVILGWYAALPRKGKK